MKKLTLHCTDLDSWLWFQKIESMPTEELIGRLKRTEPPNDNMRRGTAWHSILEDPPETIDVVEKDGFIFKVECDASIILPQVSEIRGVKQYDVDGVNVTLTGGCDGITGNKIDDHKLTFRPNPENYTDSYQWRAYLDIFNADVFEYYIYHGVEKNNEVIIKDISSMKMYRYPDMVDYLMGGMRELVGFIKSNAPELIRKAA